MNIFGKRSDLLFFTQERSQEGENPGFVYGRHLAKENSRHLATLSLVFPKRVQQFGTDDASLPRSGQCFWLVESNFPRARQIRSPTQMWVVTRHQYGFSELVSQTSFGGKTSGGVVKCRLFSQARRHCAWQTIICRQLFAGHVMGFWPNKRKKNWHRTINVFVK